MKIKKIVLPTLSALILMGTFVGCGNSTSELYDLMQNTSEITIELAQPEYKVNVRGTQSEKGNLPWIQLDKLKTYNDFRQDFDRALGIKVVTNNGENGKSGCLYVDASGDRNGNTTLEDAFRNKVFIEKYWNSSDTQKEIYGMIGKAYDDAEDMSDDTKLYAALNAYYNLLVDTENPNSFNENQSVSREQFMSAMYRMNTAVNSNYLDGWNPELDSFVKATGLSVYSAEAKQMAGFSWLDYANGSLNAQTAKQYMSRLEAVYMVVKANFPTQYDSYDMNKRVAYTDVKNAGDLTGSKNEEDTEKNREKEKWQLYVLHMLLDEHSHGIQEELYRALGVASDLNLIAPDSKGELRWDEPISKKETIQLMVNITMAKNKLEGYKTEAEDGKVNADKFGFHYGGLMADGSKVEKETAEKIAGIEEKEKPVEKQEQGTSGENTNSQTQTSSQPQQNQAQVNSQAQTSSQAQTQTSSQAQVNSQTTSEVKKNNQNQETNKANQAQTNKNSQVTSQVKKNSEIKTEKSTGGFGDIDVVAGGVIDGDVEVSVDTTLTDKLNFGG